MMPARRVASRTSRRTSRRMAASHRSPRPRRRRPRPRAPGRHGADPAARHDEGPGLLTEEEFEAKKKQILGI
jgi:hypothetical protein